MLILAFLAGIVLTVAVNRTRWAIFPLSGGPRFLAALGQPPDYTGVDLMTNQCPRCGRPPLAEHIDVAQVRQKSFCRGQRAMRMEATNALAAAGHPPEVFGIVAAIPIDDDAPVET